MGGSIWLSIKAACAHPCAELASSESSTLEILVSGWNGDGDGDRRAPPPPSARSKACLNPETVPQKTVQTARTLQARGIKEDVALNGHLLPKMRTAKKRKRASEE